MNDKVGCTVIPFLFLIFNRTDSRSENYIFITFFWVKYIKLMGAVLNDLKASSGSLKTLAQSSF